MLAALGPLLLCYLHQVSVAQASKPLGLQAVSHRHSSCLGDKEPELAKSSHIVP